MPLFFSWLNRVKCEATGTCDIAIGDSLVPDGHTDD